MATNSQLQVTELDFDQILQNLVNFMKADPTFTDYDFSGSGLRMLARVLAYVTFYNGVYVSSAVNEAFLDTAQLRSSVVSHARMLGYTPHGVMSAHLTANVSIQTANSNALEITLPRHTQFVLQSNSSFIFYNPDDISMNLNSTSLLYTSQDVTLIEGQPATFRFVVDLTNPTQRFIIPNANIDYSTIEVSVQDSLTSNVVTAFQLANTKLLLSNTDPVYWVEESYNTFPELRFGNGVIGKALEQGNVIIANYFISRGTDANGIRGPFRIPSANVAGFLRGATDADANTVPSQGGGAIQDLDEIRFLAPLVYQTQNRCVTVDDYEAIILRDYGENIATINVFGGEKGDPNDPKARPVLGKVFIVLKPKIGLRFTDTIKQFIVTNIVQPRAIVGTIAEVIDPDYVFIAINALVKYSPKDTPLSASQLKETVANNILEYCREHVEKFDTSFRFSKLTRVIDETDDSIDSVQVRLDLEKHFVPVLGKSNQTVLRFGVPLRQEGNRALLEVSSHRFSYARSSDGVVIDNCFLLDADGGVDVVHHEANGVITIVQPNVGTIDANAGFIALTNFIPLAIENNSIEVHVRVRPAVNDFAPALNLLYTTDPTGDDLNLIVQADTEVTPADQAAFFTAGIL